MTNRLRNLIFISHANPEDNTFARWLSLKLASEGYRVWCDLTRLLGGEDFWADIEVALRDHAIKLVYVLSRDSNRKPGTLQELQVGQTVARAENLKDFVIPLRLDDLPFSDINIQLARLNAIDLREGWSQGLRSLLEKLELDGVEKDSRFSPRGVASWWEMQGATHSNIEDEVDEYISNWLPIQQMPDSVYIHFVPRRRSWSGRRETLPYPAYQRADSLVSFAANEDLNENTPTQASIYDSSRIPLGDFVDGIDDPVIVERQEAQNIVVNLLRQAWENLVDSRGMSTHGMANRSIAAFLEEGFVQGNRVSVPRGLGGSNRRALVGYRTLPSVDEKEERRRYWHFAVQSWPTLRPFAAYKLTPRLLFSDDGRTILSGNRVHAMRRRESRNWWNPEWRDRTLGLVNWLANGEQWIEVELGSDVVPKVAARPILFASPVTYLEPTVQESSNDHTDDHLQQSTERE